MVGVGNGIVIDNPCHKTVSCPNRDCIGVIISIVIVVVVVVAGVIAGMIVWQLVDLLCNGLEQ